jgi:hypothetical protein
MTHEDASRMSSVARAHSAQWWSRWLCRAWLVLVAVSLAVIGVALARPGEFLIVGDRALYILAMTWLLIELVLTRARCCSWRRGWRRFHFFVASAVLDLRAKTLARTIVRQR